jgi:hypothetical protein
VVRGFRRATVTMPAGRSSVAAGPRHHEEHPHALVSASGAGLKAIFMEGVLDLRVDELTNQLDEGSRLDQRGRFLPSCVPASTAGSI